jgi:flagellar hook protein FlgE
MIPSLYSAVSALQNHQKMMSVVANNLSNVNTMGFKYSRSIFADTLSQTLIEPSEAIEGISAGSNGVQIGLGSQLNAITPVFTQGSLQATNLPTDIAIEGEGFIVVQDPATEQIFYTRAGALQFNSENLLITSGGMLVQGDIAGGSTLEVPNDPDNPMVSFSISPSGNIVALLQDGTVVDDIGQIALQRFTNPQALKKVGQNMYIETPAAGAALSDTVPAGTGGLGYIRAGFLEMSNVDMGSEFSEMIRAQRGLQANTRVITSSDEILQEIINLKR